MTTKGIDTTVSTITVAQLADYDFVCRYILDAPSGIKKELTKAEVARYSAGRKRVVSNFEWAERPPDTVAEGKAHARAFLDWAKDFKVPEWSPCYFSQDANNPAGKYVNYFTGVADVITPERSGMYGNGACYRHLLAHGQIKWAWQSKSSSYAGNNTTTGANLVQQLKTANVGGHVVDVNIAKTALYGGWLLGEEDPMADATLSAATLRDIADEMLVRDSGVLKAIPGDPASAGPSVSLATRVSVDASRLRRVEIAVTALTAQVRALATPAQIAAAVKAALGAGPTVTEEQLEAAILGALKALAADDGV